MHWGVTGVQILLFGVLVFAISNNSINCSGYFKFCTSSLLQTNSVYLISAITASIILGIMSFKFLSWYRLNRRNFMLLFYGLTAATIAIAITGDAYTKLMLVKIVEEKTPPGVAPQSSFIYKTFKKYQGEIQYKVVNPYMTTLWVSPTSTNSVKNNLDQLAALPYIFMWLAIATLLRQYYKSIRGGDKKFPLKFWIILAVPLVLYLVVIGFYALAISISQDRSLRQSIRNSALEVSELLDLGTPYMQQEIERRVLRVIKEQQEALTEQTGVEPSLTDNEIKQYLKTV